jgi:adenylate kinase
VRMIMLGPPGAGKGTQAKRIANEFKIPHISTGEILRNAIKDKTPLGEKAQEYMQKGLLVPDEIVTGLVKERVKEPDCDNGFILDGFPRTINQAKSLEDMGIGIDSVININVCEEDLIERFTGRRVCKTCGATFHVKFDPPSKPNICDKCQGELIIRADDEMSTVKKRLKVYTEQTAPLIDFYKNKKLLIDIDGTKPIDEVFSSILKRLRGEAV